MSQKVAQNSSCYTKVMFEGQSPNIWATSTSNFFTKNFQKSPNLFTVLRLAIPKASVAWVKGSGGPLGWKIIPRQEQGEQQSSNPSQKRALKTASPSPPSKRKDFFQDTLKPKPFSFGLNVTKLKQQRRRRRCRRLLLRRLGEIQGQSFWRFG